jgi:hypothetical protein
MTFAYIMQSVGSGRPRPISLPGQDWQFFLIFSGRLLCSASGQSAAVFVFVREAMRPTPQGLADNCSPSPSDNPPT